MNKLNKELLARALVEGVDESYDGTHVSLASGNHKYDGFHTLDNTSNDEFWQYVCTKEEYLAAKAHKEGVKAVVDAVKYWQGSSHKNGKHEGHHTHIINAVGTDRFYTAYKSDVHHHVIICTINKYNQYIKECEANFGKSITYTEYKKDFKAFSELDLKLAQPVFTQAMDDAGELPKVGMRCLINFPDIDDAWYEYTIDFIGAHTFIASCKDVTERFGRIDDTYFKPIDTRTEKEKAIEKAITNLMFYGDQTQTSQKANETLIAIMEGRITGVKWVGK